MGLGSRTQPHDRAIALGTPQTALFSASGLIPTAASTAQAGHWGNLMAYLLETASEDACTGRAAGDTRHPSRSALTTSGGVA